MHFFRADNEVANTKSPRSSVTSTNPDCFPSVISLSFPQLGNFNIWVPATRTPDYIEYASLIHGAIPVATGRTPRKERMAYCNSSQLMEHTENLDGLMGLSMSMAEINIIYSPPMPPLRFDDVFAELTTAALTPL